MQATRISPTAIELLPAKPLIDKVAIATMARDAHVVGRAPDWMLDGTECQFDGESIPTIGLALNYARQYDGLRRLVIVIPVAIGRLAARGMLGRAPVPVTIVESRQEALRLLGGG